LDLKRALPRFLARALIISAIRDRGTIPSMLMGVSGERALRVLFRALGHGQLPIE